MAERDVMIHGYL